MVEQAKKSRADLYWCRYGLAETPRPVSEVQREARVWSRADDGCANCLQAPGQDARGADENVAIAQRRCKRGDNVERPSADFTFVSGHKNIVIANAGAATRLHGGESNGKLCWFLICGLPCLTDSCREGKGQLASVRRAWFCMRVCGALLAGPWR